MTYCILADTAFDWENIMLIVQILPMMCLILGALIGFATGLRKMSRIGVSWMLAVGVYSFLLEIFKSSLGEGDSTTPALVAMIISAIIGMIAYVVVTNILEPREKDIKQSDIRKVLEKEDKFRKIEKEEIEELKRDRRADEDDFERLERRQKRRRRRYLEKMREKTSFLSRIIAAVEYGVVAVFVVGTIIDVVFLLISISGFSTGVLAPLCELERFKETIARADSKAFDYVLIGLLMLFVKKGYESGILNSVHNIFSSVSSMLSCALGFYIPFSSIGAEGGALGFTSKIVAKIATWVEGVVAGSLPIAIPANAYQTVGQIAVGIAYTVALIIATSLIAKILFKFVELSYNNDKFHFIDGCFGVFRGVFIFGIVVGCLLLVLMVLEYLSWVYGLDELLAGTQTLGFYNAIEGLVGDFVKKVVGFLSSGK